MHKTTLYGHIDEKGILHLHNQKRLNEDLRLMKECDVEISIKKKGKRTNKQNRYYRGCVLKEIQVRLRELGNDFDMDTIHEYLKQRFNAVKVFTPHGEVIEFGETTTEMNRGEFVEFVEKIRQWAAESLDINIPDPGEQVKVFN